jgi:succinate dehydrogenase / fumarate reductase iron-sulfur subunit
VSADTATAGTALTLSLDVWRQSASGERGRFVRYEMADVSVDMSFLELLDRLNDRLERAGEEPIAFDHDCREGICGSCGFLIDGHAHGPLPGVTVCQLHMRSFKDGDHLTIEPWRASAFPVIKDLVVDRSAFDRVIQAGGFISANTGIAPEANALPVARHNADLAMDAAACIGCGACVASCKNASAMLFTGAKASQLALLPQGQPERHRRAVSMVEAMDAAGFGNCTNERECQGNCPKQIDFSNIARLNRDYVVGRLRSTD